MRTTVKHFRMLVAAMAMGAVVAACTDDDNYSIKEARLDGNTTVLGQLEAYSHVTSFNLVTDADAEWTATVEWDAEEYNQPAYVYPKKGTGPATLRVVSLDNPTQQTRTATLKITFPRDESKNITQTITQKRGSDTNGDNYDAAQEAGAVARGVGYGYNAYAGYCDKYATKLPILEIDRMFTDKAVVYDYSTIKQTQVEESGASAEELGRKLNASMHAEASGWGFSATVDASYDNLHKQNESYEFAWMDINVETCNAKLNMAPKRVFDEYMTDEAWDDINGVLVQGKRSPYVSYPSTDEGFSKLVNDYGTHLVVGGILGGRLHTQVTCNTTNMTSAFNAKTSLEVTYSGPFVSDMSAKSKFQMAQTQAKNHTAFYYSASVRGGGQGDGTKAAMQDVLDKMSKARQGLKSEASYSYDDDMTVEIPDYSGTYEAAANEWKTSLQLNGNTESEMEEWLEHLALVDFHDDNDLIPLWELVSEELYPERRAAFKLWYETKLMADPSILSTKPKSTIVNPPTIIGEELLQTMEKAGTDESLIRDIYLSDGKHVARVCSEFIPQINPSKRVNVIYPIVDSRPRYNLGIYLGGEASYPSYVSWGQYEDPTTPLLTPITNTEVGGYKTVYLRGNHFTIFPDENFSESQYLTTTSKPYTLIMSDNGEQIEYPLVKINDYIYTRNLYRARAYQNGTPQMSGKVPCNSNHLNAFSVFSRYDDATQNVDWYMVSNYTNSLNRWGGFAPQGWTVPYASQYQKMIDNIAGIAGNKPDGTIGASFLKGGVYGLNTKATGFIGVGFVTDSHGYFDAVSLNNKEVLYLGAIADADREKLDGTGNVYGKRHELESQFRCDALAVRPSEGTAAMTWFLDQSIVLLDNEKITDTSIWPESVRNKDNWKDHHGSVIGTVNYVYNNTKYDMPAQKVCFPVIICQRVVK